MNPNTHINAILVTFFINHGSHCGWEELVWQELPPEQLQAEDWKTQPGSDADEPVYGVVVRIDQDSYVDLCTIWYNTATGTFYRSASWHEVDLQEEEAAWEERTRAQNI